MARISRSTSLPAAGEYLRLEDFFEPDFFDAEPRVLFLALLPRVLFLALLLRVLFLALPRVLFFAVLREEREREALPLELLLDFFLAAFFVAITILLGGQMASSLGQVASGDCRKVASRRTSERILVTRRGE
ncbi:MAG TPA: hypothetical protein VF786_07320 [Terriglobales bacterium]